MSLEENLKEASIKYLNTINILSIDFISSKDKEYLRYLLNNNILLDEDIDMFLKNAIFRQARNDYNRMIASEGFNRLYPDHIGTTEYFAYALEENFFSKDEQSQINFDHGDTIESYIKSYKELNLIPNLKKRLLSPKQNNPIWNDISHCC